MIFVTVGTDTHDFSRLVRKMDELGLKEKVVMQIGNTRYVPRHARWFRFERDRVIESLYKKADVIVTHAGAGSIIRSLQNGKIPVVVPRLKECGEHINSHQLDIARTLGKRGKVICVEDVDSLDRAVKAKGKGTPAKDETLSKKLGEWLADYEKEIS